MDLDKSTDLIKYVHYLFEKNPISSALSSEPQFQKCCLEHRLDRRSTNYNLDSENNIKVLLAVSGAGKTRMILELLFQNFGYYFTLSRSKHDFGSADLCYCRKLSDQTPNMVDYYLRLLFATRITICNYLMTLGYTQPWQILLAQLHPIAVFKYDIFHNVFHNLVSLGNKYISFPQCDSNFPFIAIDEIQAALEGEIVHLSSRSSNRRPFFTPLVYYSKMEGMFPQFVVAGTGINFEYLKELMVSTTLKRDECTWVDISDFHPLTKQQVVDYTRTVLSEFGTDEDQVESIVEKMSLFELCHGRARFTAYIIDGFLKSRDIDLSIAEFVSTLSDVDSPGFPIRFLIRDIKGIRNERTIGRKTLFTIICDGLIEFIKNGRAILMVSSEDAATAINYGLGFGVHEENGPCNSVEMTELAVIECLRYFIPFYDIVQRFSESIASCPNPQMVGYLLEYLVAFALVSNHCTRKETQRIHVSQDSTSFYLGCDDPTSVSFPDHMCGPDIIYKSTKTKCIYIVQVKFVNRLSKQERANAYQTTNPDRFYCQRKSGNVLKGFYIKRRNLLASLAGLQGNGYAVKRMLFIHSGQPQTTDIDGMQVISSNNSPEFFDGIGPGIWEYLDSIRNDFTSP